MDDINQVLEETLLLSDDSITNNEEIFDRNNKFINIFKDIYNTENDKLPYHINLLDILWANENAHSRIFTELLKQEKHKRHEVLESFFEYLKLDSRHNLNLIKPTITSEKNRIDLLILDEKYALIIENKIHNASDRNGQIASYIEKVKQKGYKEAQIFIVYLTRDGNKVCEDISWNFNERNYKKYFEGRYFEISYKKDILPWLKAKIKPKYKGNDNYLETTLEQYIDYLDGMFNQRKIQDNMNLQLQNYIEQELDFTSDPVDNLSLLTNKLEDINKVKEQIDKLVQKTQKECWKNWIETLKREFPNHKIFDNTDDDELMKIGVIIELNRKSKFSVLIENEENQLTYGIGIHNASNDIIKTVSSKLESLLEGFENNDWWYGSKITSYEDGYNCLKSLIIEVENNM